MAQGSAPWKHWFYVCATVIKQLYDTVFVYSFLSVGKSVCFILTLVGGGILSWGTWGKFERQTLYFLHSGEFIMHLFMVTFFFLWLF